MFVSANKRNFERVMKVPKEERLVLFDFDDEEDDPSVFKKPLSEEKSPIFVKYEKKRPFEEIDEDIRDEINTILDEFKDGIGLSLFEKRRRIEMYSEAVCKETISKIEEVWKTKQQQILEVNNKFYPKFMELFKQWGLEKQKYQKQQETLINIFKQQQMMLRQCKIKQNQRMKLIMQMVTRYIQILRDMECKNGNLSNDSIIELKNEIAMYQKKYMMETQKQEIANIRKSLQAILFE